MIQSFVDLITNSSTSVFQWAGNPDKLKGIIDTVLKISGSELTSDDLFEIYIDESNAHEEYLYYIEDYASGDDMNRLQEAVGTSKFEEIVLEIRERDNDTYKSFKEWEESSYEEKFYSTFFKVIPLDPRWENEAKLLRDINHLFSYDAVYC